MIDSTCTAPCVSFCRTLLRQQRALQREGEDRGSYECVIVVRWRTLEI